MFLEMIPPAIFFFITFQLLALTQALILKEYGISVTAFLNATIMALVVAKVVLIVDEVGNKNRHTGKPLIYRVVWETTVYFIFCLLVKYIEHLVHFWKQSNGFGEANTKLFEEIVWSHFWGVQIWLLILLFMYCVFRELARAIGREKIIRLFFYDSEVINK